MARRGSPSRTCAAGRPAPSAGTGAQSCTVQLAGGSGMSAARPGRGRTMTPRSGEPSRLKSPTLASAGPVARAAPKTRASASRASAAVAGEKSASMTAARRCSGAAGAGIGIRSTGALRARARAPNPPAHNERPARSAVVRWEWLMWDMGRWGPAGGRPAPERSQRVEERDELVLLRRAEVPVAVDDGGGFPGVAEDRLVAGQRRSIVHEPAAAARAPQRGRAHLVARRLSAVLHDPVSGPHVVEQEVAERVDQLVAE